jgi:hypothetical protein
MNKQAKWINAFALRFIRVKDRNGKPTADGRVSEQARGLAVDSLTPPW